MATETWRPGSERRDRTRASSYNFDDRDYYVGNHNKGRTFSYNSSSFSGHSGARETGVVEKLLHSYGFIQCCDRELRIFFHYSQINEDPEDICVGDEMEFEISSDQRTGKPIACRVIRLEPGSVSFEIRSEDKVEGIIDAEPKLPLKNNAKSPSNGIIDPDMGRVSYQRNGEYFYLSFSLNDVSSSGTPLHKGDKVEFYVATDKRTGVVRARELTLLEAADTEKCQGVVSSMKESFGFIERADKVSEIFFHYSEFIGDINELLLGDDVEFGIQARNSKEVAVRVEKLPEGTVKFEDVSSERYQGTVDRPLSKSASKRQHDPLHGKIVYTLSDNEDTEGEIVFSERDLHGDFSLRAGDLVEFNIAVDRRDSLKRATNISLVDIAEANGGETREMGVVASLKEGCDRDARMFFHYSELLDSAHQIQVGDEVEFAVSEGIMLVYDITNDKSFENIKNWIRNIEEHASSDVEKMVLGNKCDMEDRRLVSKERGTQLATEYGIKFMETSAKASINVEEAFFTLARDIKLKMDKKLEQSSPQASSTIRVTQQPKQSKGFFRCTIL